MTFGLQKLAHLHSLREAILCRFNENICYEWQRQLDYRNSTITQEI